ncbi:hypothetical protein HAU47_03850 [Weissella confusa]|uniref:hypothetical protein n=1 Tax=Weissella confusa TaxID=1583 RepID=UPI001081AADA|nr:hypothetical protein [Weissella confusa]MBJ7619732.1 hypothetical protein [Weissella confusa]MBJ7667067.1 hypothetical protein [Weissella confusa]
MKKIISILAGAIVVISLIFGALSLSRSDSKDNATSSSISSKHRSSEKTKQTSSTDAIGNSAASSSSVAIISNSSTTSSQAVSSTPSQQPSSAANVDPNSTASGQEITADMIKQAQDDLNAAGLPADRFAPSDIKTMIRQASEQHTTVVKIARQNFHE